MPSPRAIEGPIRANLADKMVFVAGPRQVGKTTLARHILDEAPGGVYLDWDNRAHRSEIRAARWPGGRSLVVLDEIHRWRAWKGWLKGEFDAHRDRLRFLVTGSARMDVYRRGGDSLQGRYHDYRLHPFSVAEIERGGRSNAELPAPRGARFENLIAMHLLKFCHFLEDRDGHAAELCYLRDKSGREVDFLVTVGRKPWFAVEAKVAETGIDPSLVYFRERLNLGQCYQVVLDGTRDFVQHGIRCLPASRFLSALA